MVSLSDTKNGHENGDYSNDVHALNRVQSEYNGAVSKLNEAK